MIDDPQTHAAELERQQLTKRAHCLVAQIATRPGAVKLLKGIIPLLQIYANYKRKGVRYER